MHKDATLGRRDVLRLGAGIGLAAGVLPLLSACGNGSSSSEGGTIGTANVVNTGSNNTYTLQELLNRQGYLEEFGIAADTQNVSDGGRLMGNLLNGRSDITLLSGFGQVLPAIEKGGALKVVAGAGVLTGQAVYTAKPEITAVSDLAGRTVGTGAPGALLHQLVVALLTNNDVDPGSVEFVNIGASGDVFRAVAAGKVDAGPALVDVYDQQDKYGVHAIADLWTELPEYTYQGSYASEEAIEQKRDVLVGTLAAYCKLYRFVSGPDSENAFMDAYAAAVSGGDPAEGQAQWQFAQENQPYALDLVISDERINYMQELNVQQGIQNGVLPIEDVADMSIAREAAQLADGR